VFRLSNTAVIFENHSDQQFFLDNRFIDTSSAFLIHGIGVNPIRFSPKQEQGLIPTVLMGGRMLYDKGVDIFVEAARLVKSRAEARFVLVGLPDPGNPESIAESVLRDWDNDGVIEWLGWQSDMASIFDQTHIVAFPTRYGEGVPTFLIEGAACGKPLVASNLPGCRSVVQEGINGYLISPDDPEELAIALERLISSPELRLKFGSESRKIFLRKFTDEKINQATISVYEQRT
jgi:glycosyltransferase involved in cell wall biosynthesis